MSAHFAQRGIAPSAVDVRRSDGFTLIELMVAMVMGMFVILALVVVQKSFEGQRRTSVSGNDVDNAGAYVLSQLDGMLRSAGSSFTQAYQQSYGCTLTVAQGGTVLVPPAAALPAPFDNVMAALPGQVIRMAPVLILPGNTTPANLNNGNGSSDVLIIMSGAGYAGNLQTQFTGVPTSNGLTLESTTSFQANDLALIMEATGSTGPAPCLLSQVAGGFANAAGNTALPLGAPSSGTNYYSTSPVSPATFTIGSTVVSIGNPSKGNNPNFMVIGVGAGSQLYSYDLLNLSGNQLTPIGDSVMELHALYLTQTNTGNGFVGVDPSVAGSNYTPAALMAGTLAASASLKSIKAVRIGLILKSPLLEKPTPAGVHVAPASVSLFTGLQDANNNPLTYVRNLSGNNCSNTANVACELDYRYRTLELTIPLRNPLY